MKAESADYDLHLTVKIRVQAPPQRGSAPAGGPGFDYPQRGFSLPAFNYLLRLIYTGRAIEL